MKILRKLQKGFKEAIKPLRQTPRLWQYLLTLSNSSVSHVSLNFVFPVPEQISKGIS